MDKRLLFLLLVGTYCLLVFLSNYLLVSEKLYLNTFAEQLTYEQIQETITSNKKWEWLNYVIMPLVVLIKLALVAMCLSIGMFFANGQPMYKRMFGVALVAEFIFLVPSVLKILWFTCVETNYTMQNLQWFTPLSALNFFEVNSLDPWWVYPLQLFNVFEVLYWVLLITQVDKAMAGQKQQAGVRYGSWAFASYGTALVLWVATIMFFLVSYS